MELGYLGPESVEIKIGPRENDPGKALLGPLLEPGGRHTEGLAGPEARCVRFAGRLWAGRESGS